MFKILGADGKEYGPVQVDQVKQWIKEGRANHETMALMQGEAIWKPLAQFAEFAEVLGVKPPVATPTVPPSVFVPASAVAAAGPELPAQARQLVKGPAVGLIVTAVLGIALNATSSIMYLHGTAFVPPTPGLNPDAMRMFHLLRGPIGSIAGLVGVGLGIFILIGALKLQNLTNYGLAMAAAIIAMIPCFSPCCVLGLPFGIWALVVMSKPEVRSQFH